MPRVQDSEEVRILRYFEEGPLEKAGLLYRIIAEKMRKRMPSGRDTPKKKDTRPQRQPVQGTKSDDEESRQP